VCVTNDDKKQLRALALAPIENVLANTITDRRLFSNAKLICLRDDVADDDAALRTTGD
jgi:hypothetical protein